VQQEPLCVCGGGLLEHPRACLLTPEGRSLEGGLVQLRQQEPVWGGLVGAEW
jgi:hypothetical protein